MIPGLQELPQTILTAVEYGMLAVAALTVFSLAARLYWRARSEEDR